MSDYTYPATLRGVLEATFSRLETPYTSQSEPSSGTPFIQINTDNISMVFDVSFVFKRSEMPDFQNWLKQDNNAILRGATFDIDLPTDNGVIVQEAIFAPDGLPFIESVTNNTYNIKAKIIARTYTETILPGSFKTPENAFGYYFYSQYEYPDSLRRPLMTGYSKQDASGFSINNLDSGSYVARIDTDDIYTVYSLNFVFKPDEAAIFRAWIAQDSFNMLKGAAFNIPLLTEYGEIIQVVRFADGGYPQLTGKSAGKLTYSAKVIARTQMDNVNGLDDAVFAPQVFSTLLYPFFAETESLSMTSFARVGGGLSAPYQDFMRFGSMILAGGEVSPLPIVDYDAGSEDLSFISLILAGGFVRGSRLDYMQQDPESLNMSSALLAGGTLTTVAIRYNSTTFDTDNLNFSSAILAGGSVGV